ncbi:MAG: cation:proton antiporter [Candidatus Sungbacteria bacterium]|nr:cation:proton antiporter [Candidatus Sungbacteria bacterium]
MFALRIVPKSAVMYCVLAAGLVIVGLASREAHAVFGFFERSADAHLLMVFFTFALICIASFVVFLLAHEAGLPSFVVAIFFGIAAREFFGPIVNHSVALGAVVGLGSTLILFGGGLETPWDNFKKLVWKILSLSFLGLFLTAFLFSLVLGRLGVVLGAHSRWKVDQICDMIGLVLLWLVWLGREKTMSFQFGSSLVGVKCGKCGEDMISPVYRDDRMVCSDCHDKSLIDIRRADEVAARFGFAPSPRGDDVPTF